MSEVKISSIAIELGKKRLELTLADAVKLYNELDHIFAKRECNHTRYSPFYYNTYIDIPSSTPTWTAANTSITVTDLSNGTNL